MELPIFNLQSTIFNTVTSPSAFVADWVPRLAEHLPAARRALDLAMGHGRHIPILAAAGFQTFGVDVSWDAVRSALAKARDAGTPLHAFCADMTQHPLPRARFHVVLVTRYLDRDRFAAIKDAVVPGGFVVYETFTRRQCEHGRGPTSPDHLLEPGELATRFTDFDALWSEETTAPDALARIVARRR
jgi:SAM-dependent methyltransferase